MDLNFKLKLNKEEFFYDQNTVKVSIIVLILLTIFLNVKYFVGGPITDILKEKAHEKSLKKTEQQLTQNVLNITKARKVFMKKLEKQKGKNSDLISNLEAKSFIDNVDYEKTIQQIFNKVDVNTMIVNQNKVDEKNDIENTTKVLTEYSVEGTGSNIVELYNLIEHSHELLLIKNNTFNVEKTKDDGSDILKTNFTVGYYILNDSSSVELVKDTTKENMVEIIHDYDQKKDIFQANMKKPKIVKKKYKVDLNRLYKKRFNLVGIIGTGSSESAVIYYRSPKKGLERLVIANGDKILLDKKEFRVYVHSDSVDVKGNGHIAFHVKK